MEKIAIQKSLDELMLDMHIINSSRDCLANCMARSENPEKGIFLHADTESGELTSPAYENNLFVLLDAADWSVCMKKELKLTKRAMRNIDNTLLLYSSYYHSKYKKILK